MMCEQRVNVNAHALLESASVVSTCSMQQPVPLLSCVSSPQAQAPIRARWRVSRDRKEAGLPEGRHTFLIR